MVDYRGPKFLQAFCQRWNLDLYDRVVELHIVEEGKLLGESLYNFTDLQTMTYSPTFYRVLDREPSTWPEILAEFDHPKFQVTVAGYDSGQWFTPRNLVAVRTGTTETSLSELTTYLKFQTRDEFLASFQTDSEISSDLKDMADQKAELDDVIPDLFQQLLDYRL